MNFVNKNDVAKRLKELILNKFNGIDRRLAETADLTASTLNGYTKGERIPSGENLVKLARSAGVTTDWILVGSPMGGHSFVEEESSKYLRLDLSEEERGLVEDFRGATDAGRKTARLVLQVNQEARAKPKHKTKKNIASR